MGKMSEMDAIIKELRDTAASINAVAITFSPFSAVKKRTMKPKSRLP